MREVNVPSTSLIFATPWRLWWILHPHTSEARSTVCAAHLPQLGRKKLWRRDRRDMWHASDMMDSSPTYIGEIKRARINMYIHWSITYTRRRWRRNQAPQREETWQWRRLPQSRGAGTWLHHPQRQAGGEGGADLSTTGPPMTYPSGVGRRKKNPHPKKVKEKKPMSWLEEYATVGGHGPHQRPEGWGASATSPSGMLHRGRPTR
jgi:hypothetical protein